MDFNTLSLRKFQHLKIHAKNLLWKEVRRFSQSLGKAVTEVTHQLEPGKTKRVLNFALDISRPYLQSLGLRISRQSAQQIEVVLPANPLHLDHSEELATGAVVAACEFAYARLWQKNSPKGTLTVQINSFEFEKMKALQGPLAIRAQLPALQRELLYADLGNTSRAQHEGVVQIFDEQEQIVAKILIRAEIRAPKILEWK